jgi:hypothetical protein
MEVSQVMGVPYLIIQAMDDHDLVLKTHHGDDWGSLSLRTPPPPYSYV